MKPVVPLCFMCIGARQLQPYKAESAMLTRPRAMFFQEDGERLRHCMRLKLCRSSCATGEFPRHTPQLGRLGSFLVHRDDSFGRLSALDLRLLSCRPARLCLRGTGLFNLSEVPLTEVRLGKTLAVHQDAPRKAERSSGVQSQTLS